LKKGYTVEIYSIKKLKLLVNGQNSEILEFLKSEPNVPDRNVGYCNQNTTIILYKMIYKLNEFKKKLIC
jgi:predicted nucleotidyltransferase